MSLVKRSTPYKFIAPYFAIFTLFWLWPIGYSLYLTVMNTRSFPWHFDLTANWGRVLFDPQFWQALQNTLWIVCLQTPLMLVIATLLAVVLASQKLKMKGFFRFAFFAPIVVGEVAYSAIFRLLFNTDLGPVNKFFDIIGLEPINWLYEPTSAMAVIILAVTWRWTGYNAIILLAGLQNIPRDQYEAASLDGASKLQQFFDITLPQLKPVILFCLVLSIIGSLQLFSEPALITAGGPSGSTTMLGNYMYNQGFRSFNFGYASVIAYVVVFLALITSSLQVKLLGKK